LILAGGRWQQQHNDGIAVVALPHSMEPWYQKIYKNSVSGNATARKENFMIRSNQCAVSNGVMASENCMSLFRAIQQPNMRVV